MGSQSRQNGIMSGYGKEGYDYIKKRLEEKRHSDIVADSFKDLRNNEYGSRLGAEYPARSCAGMLNPLRTRNMVSERYF